MKGVSSTECAGLDVAPDVASVLTDPDLALPTSADLNAITNTIANGPEVTAAPAVIEGEVKE